MRAAYIESLGPPEHIHLGELPAPQPGPGEVLVDVLASTVNRVDTFVRSGRYRTDISFPFVVGRDLVGVVTASQTPEFPVATKVWCNSLGHAGRQGAACEQVVVPVERLYRLPARVDILDAVAALHPAATACLAVRIHGQIHSGETILITGGAGNVGSAAVSLAALGGAEVVTTAHPRDHEYCRALGAAHVFDYRRRDLVARIAALRPGGLNAYVDTHGGNDLAGAVRLLAPRGRIVVLAGVDAHRNLPVGPLYLKDGTVTGFAISTATVTELREVADIINPLIGGGLLRPRRITTMPLDRIAHAHRLIEGGVPGGTRIVLDIRSGP